MKITVDVDETTIKDNVTSYICRQLRNSIKEEIQIFVISEVERMCNEGKINKIIQDVAGDIWEKEARRIIQKKVMWNGQNKEDHPMYFELLQEYVDDLVCDIKNNQKENILIETIAKEIAENYKLYKNKRDKLAEAIEMIQRKGVLKDDCD